MVTHTVSHVSHAGSAKGNHLAIPVTTELKKKESARFSRRQIWQSFGVVSTLLIGAAALAPDAFEIPMDLRPWVFLASILWFFAYCAGMFDI